MEQSNEALFAAARHLEALHRVTHYAESEILYTPAQSDREPDILQPAAAAATNAPNDAAGSTQDTADKTHRKRRRRAKRDGADAEGHAFARDPDTGVTYRAWTGDANSSRHVVIVRTDPAARLQRESCYVLGRVGNMGGVSMAVWKSHVFLAWAGPGNRVNIAVSPDGSASQAWRAAVRGRMGLCVARPEIAISPDGELVLTVRGEDFVLRTATCTDPLCLFFGGLEAQEQEGDYDRERDEDSDGGCDDSDDSDDDEALSDDEQLEGIRDSIALTFICAALTLIISVYQAIRG